MRRIVQARCLPNLILQVLEPGQSLPEGHPAAGKAPVDGQATAFICQDMTCSLPITDPDELRRALGSSGID